ncbi:MAG: hypothetical protein AAGC90_02265, partial [Curtobacterium sp.]
MDKPLRAPWHAAIRYALVGTGVSAAAVLLSLTFGAHSASATTAPPAQTQSQSGLVGGLVQGLGDTVHGVAGGVGQVLGDVVDPVHQAVAPAAPAAPAPAAPVPAAPAPAAPAPAPA